MSKFLKAVKTSQSDLVYLVRLKDENPLTAWYYVQVKSRAILPVFLQKVKTGITLADYGTILYSGWGDQPPEDMRAKIKEQFG